jgi:FkbM family methyltransferase
MFTIPVAHSVGPTGRVLGVEASPRIFSYLEHNVKRSQLTNIALECCAVQDAGTSEVEFYDAPLSHFGMGSMAPQFGAQAPRVRAETLDSILSRHRLSRIDVLKVDVEGFEAAVFRGANRLLTGIAPPVVVFEFCDWAEKRAFGRTGLAQECLRDHGYRFWRLPTLLAGGPPLQDVILEGSDMLVALPPDGHAGADGGGV